ncbi:SOS response-associated peptidase, partial [Enterovirga rhinocerotis]
MCNLYSVTTNQEAIRRLFRVDHDLTGNLPPLPGVFPDYAAPIVRVDGDERVLAMARWGMPSSRKALMDAASSRADKLRAKGREVDFDELLRLEPDKGTTNVRNTASRHWKAWREPTHRCLVPFTSFSEFNKAADGDIWFAFGEHRPFAAFAGIWTPQWTSVRKVKTGPETIDLFAFLTTEPSEPVASIHPKAMPVILTTEAERDA